MCAKNLETLISICMYMLLYCICSMRVGRIMYFCGIWRRAYPNTILTTVYHTAPDRPTPKRPVSQSRGPSRNYLYFTRNLLHTYRGIIMTDPSTQYRSLRNRLYCTYNLFYKLVCRLSTKCHFADMLERKKVENYKFCQIRYFPLVKELLL